MNQSDKPIHIFGHLNPDTDSTCSAIGYSYLKNQIDPSNTYIPAVLGKINDETAYVLQYFEVEEPKLLKNLKPQVSDIGVKAVGCVHEKDPVKRVLEAISQQIGRSVPVVDDNERLIGVVSIPDIVPMLLGAYSQEIKMPLKNLINTLELRILSGDLDENITCDHIYMFNDLTFDHEITAHDVLICNPIEFAAGYVITLGAGFIIVTEGYNIGQDLIDSNHSGVVFASPKTTYELVQSINHALPITSIVKKDQLEYFTTYETIDDVKKNMMTSEHQRFPVVDEWGYIKGMISKGSLVEVEQKKAILVDHNERGQSIEGIDSITILEIIDHHRVADVQTIAPLYFRVEPVGCTCTIITKMFEEKGVEIPKHIAGILLSAILSDTLIFKSPTCTEEDKLMAIKLSLIADVQINQYGMKMLTKGEKIQEKKPQDILLSDMKKFAFGEYKVVISQITIGDFEGFFKIFEVMVQTMEEKAANESIDLIVLMVTNIVIGGTELIAVGKAKWIADRAFGMSREDSSIFLNGTFSRKKQVVPKLMRAAQL